MKLIKINKVENGWKEISLPFSSYNINPLDIDEVIQELKDCIKDLEEDKTKTEKELIVSTKKFTEVQEYYKQGYKLIQAVSHSYYDVSISDVYIITEYILELKNKFA